MKPNKTKELNEEIKRLAKECQLDSWSAFVNEMTMPSDIYAAMASGRPELLKLIEPRDLSAAEMKIFLIIIATLLNTNMALREHSQRLAQFTGQWADAFRALHSIGNRIERFANFDHFEDEDDV